MTRIQVGGRGYWYEEILRYELHVPVPANTLTQPGAPMTHVRLILNELEEVVYPGKYQGDPGTLFKRHVVVDLPPGPISEAFRFFCEAFAKSNAILDLDDRLARKSEILAMMERVNQENRAKAEAQGTAPPPVSRPSGPTLLKPIKKPTE